MKLVKGDPSRYLRQMLLSDFDYEGQNKLAEASVLIIGAGGLGAPVIQYLAAAGVGKITLCDDDRIEITNLNRQTLFQEQDIGKYKAEVAAKFVNHINSDVEVTTIKDRISIHNILDLFSHQNCVVDCTDGIANKYLINDAAVLTKCPLIHGSAIGYQGRFMTIRPETGCLRCFFPEKPNLTAMPSCSTLGILGPICGIIGSFMATETLKLLIDSSRSITEYTLINCQSGIQMKRFEVTKNEECLVCSDNVTIKKLSPIDYEFT